MVFNCPRCDNELHLSEELLQEAKSTGITFSCRECGCFFDLRIILPRNGEFLVRDDDLLPAQAVDPLSQNGEETLRHSSQLIELIEED
jgi:hypothetical protein